MLVVDAQVLGLTAGRIWLNREESLAPKREVGAARMKAARMKRRSAGRITSGRRGRRGTASVGDELSRNCARDGRDEEEDLRRGR